MKIFIIIFFLFLSSILGDEVKIKKSSTNMFWGNIIKLLYKERPKKIILKRNSSASKFTIYENKIIRRITIEKALPFNELPKDSTSLKYHSLNFLNNIHVNTLDLIIKNNLLFEENEKLKDYLISQSERILRNLPFIFDAKINVSEVAQDSVDVLILTHDKRSFNLAGSVNSKFDYYAKLTNINFLGIGAELSHKWSNNLTKGDRYGNQTIFALKNISRSFLDLEMQYLNSYKQDFRSTKLSRKFIIPKVIWAGGAQYYLQEKKLGKEEQEKLQVSSIRNEYHDFWLSKAFVLWQNENNKEENLALAFSYKREGNTYFTHILAENYQGKYQDYTSNYYSLDLFKNNYYKGNMIFQFGKTEDIPFGYKIGFIYANQRGSLFSRHYLGFNIGRAKYFKFLGYLSFNAEYGEFLRRKQGEEGVLHLNFNYFSNLYSYESFFIRSYLRLNYKIGINRLYGETIGFNTNDDIRGLSSSIKGTQKFSLSFESVLFTPYQILDFNLTNFCFVDIGTINSRKKLFLESPYYSAIGFGFRANNDYLIISNFQFMFSYHFRTDEAIDSYLLEISDGRKFNLPDFNPSEPGIIDF